MSMNYQIVFAGNQTSGNAGAKAKKKIVFGLQYVLLPLLTYDSQGPTSSEDEKDVRDQEEALRKQFDQEFKRFSSQGETANTNNTNRFNIVSSPVNDVGSSFTTVDSGRERAQRNEFESMFGKDKDANGNSTYKMFTPVSAGGSIPVNAATLPNANLPTDPLMHDLEDIADLQDTGMFSGAYDDEVEGGVADFNNLELTKVVSPIPTTRINKDHPKEQIIRDPLSAPQTRRMTKISQEHAMVYRNKKDKRGIVVRNKARLVAQGHTQEEGIDYDEVFAPVARTKAIRLSLAYASFMRFIVYQMDVKSVFLHEKALYGLHQASRAWYETLSTYLLENGFRRRVIDKTLFIKQDKGDILLVQVYVDDIIFGSTKKSLCTEFERLMNKKFQMSSIGELTFFLRLQVMQRDDASSSAKTKTNKALLKDEEAEDMDVHLYRSMIVSLMYLTASRPDIMFIVCACARFQVTTKVSHLHAVKRIFRYLKGQPKLGLCYPRDSPFDLETFLDSDYAGTSLDRKSTTEGCQFLGKRLILWQCKKQTVVANSTTKVEYIATANCCGQVLWIQN
ncbi:putative ribonuclease H-like domain-containing protein [Tanacetum coccineum]